MKARQIQPADIADILIASLPSRPTAPTSLGGKGYGASQMKEAFDKLPLYIVERYNELIADVNDLGEDSLASVMRDTPVISHAVAAVFGLIPNCASSVILASLASEGIITAGTMMAGLFSGSGIGILVLFRVNKNFKQNLLITALLVAVGFVFGLLADFVPFLATLL